VELTPPRLAASKRFTVGATAAKGAAGPQFVLAHVCPTKARPCTQTFRSCEVRARVTTCPA